MSNKSRKIKVIFTFYWFLLVYIIAALGWWYIDLTQQNHQMTEYKIERLNEKKGSDYDNQYTIVLNEKKRKEKQYIGEGLVFFFIIIIGAILLYRAIRNQFKINQQQQNFMMAITHELKTPIAVTKLNLETLQKRRLDDSQQQDLIGNILQEASRMNSLCDNLLLSSQIEAGKYQITKEHININEVVLNCVNEFKKRFPNKEIKTVIEEESFATGDVFLLQMAINNLLENAYKYAPKETPITVRADKEKENVLISVIDQGPGIDESERKKVFQKFYRIGTDATKKSKGTGLGLFLVKRIITAHNGNVFIKNNEPNGSKFVIQLKENRS